ncbi:hypothetical protein [Streptomyces sp. YIM 98790]|uniref:hypothetical protein n=1 Tax=Streptomyces sp. YIM 98790 TaxID=2689077 RepID=UPI001408677E|nr:hypothetical protein [Streptomyces sp. YIM 98790]
MVLRSAPGAVHTAMGVGRLVSFPEVTRVLSAPQPVEGAPATAPAAALICGELICDELLCGVWPPARPRSGAAAPVARRRVPPG